MYRRLLPLPLLLFALLAGVAAYQAPLPPLPGAAWAAGSGAGAGFRLALLLFAADAVPFAGLLLLARLAAFRPNRKYAWWAAALKGTAALAAAVLAIGLIYQRGALAGDQARSLAQQTGRPVWLLLTASQAPHAILQMLALGAVLSLPFFWSIRGAATGSIRRALFEGWAEARRRPWAWGLALAPAALLQTFVTPLIVAWAVQY